MSGVNPEFGEHAAAATPEWARKNTIYARFGLPSAVLTQMVIDGRVTAKKIDADCRNSAALYRVADVRRAIEELADWRECGFGGSNGGGGEC